MSLTIYSMEGCSQCVQAAKYLEQKGVKFSVVKIDEDFAAYDFIKAEGHRSMPQIYQGGKLAVQGGYAGLLKLTESQLEIFKNR